MARINRDLALAQAFFAHLRANNRDVVLSYCATDLSGSVDRAALGWTTHFSFIDLAELADRHGFRIPQHAGRHLRPQLAGENMVCRRSRCGHPLQDVRRNVSRFGGQLEAMLRNVAVVPPA